MMVILTPYDIASVDKEISINDVNLLKDISTLSLRSIQCASFVIYTNGETVRFLKYRSDPEPWMTEMALKYYNSRHNRFIC